MVATNLPGRAHAIGPGPVPWSRSSACWPRVIRTSRRVGAHQLVAGDLPEGLVDPVASRHGCNPRGGPPLPTDRSAAGDQLDQLLVERRDVVGLAAGDQVAVDDDLLVDPGAAGVAEVG